MTDQPTAVSELKDNLYRVNASGGLRLRQTAKIAPDNIITLMPNGITVHMLELGTDWSLIQYDTASGYASTAYLVKIAPIRVLLDVPYHSQEDTDARKFRNDCGAACCNMLLQHFHRGTFKTDDLSAETTLVNRDNGLYTQDLVKLLARHNLPAVYDARPTPSAIKADLDKGLPSIALIWYGKLLGRQNQPDTGGHFVLIVGYSDDSYWLNDPDWYAGQRDVGHQWQVPATQLEAALREAVYVRPNQMG